MNAVCGAQSARAQGNKTVVTATCILRNEPAELEINMPFNEFLVAYEKFVNGSLIQNAFPTLSAIEREFILNGITESEWDEVFKEEE